MDRSAVKSVSRRLVIELVAVVLASFHAGLPKGSSHAQTWRAVLQHPMLVLHILISVVIVAEAVIFLLRSVRHLRTGWTALAVTGTVLVLLAFAAGDRYLATQQLAAINLMGLAWFVALLTYSLGWYLARRTPSPDALSTR